MSRTGGADNPVDALDVIGSYVAAVHIKDGTPPRNGRELGSEMPIGKGHVDFPAFFRKLKKLGCRGAVTIEREICGRQQLRDIRLSIRYLSPML